MKTKTLINYKTVGNGRWKFESIKNYCKKKGIPLKSASYQYHEPCAPFYYENLDINTGKIKSNSSSDPLRDMLGL